MKNTYIIPEVTIFNVSIAERMIATSPDAPTVSSTNAALGDGNNLSNSNYMDDQSTPWYK